MRRKILILSILIGLFLSLFFFKFKDGSGESEYRILCIGDSITESDYGSYVKFLKTFFLNDGVIISVISAAKPGYTSGEYLKFLKSSNILKKYNPDFILIMLGTNDVRIDSDRTSVKRFVANMVSILKIIKEYEKKREHSIKVFLLTPPPIHKIDIRVFNDISRKRMQKEIIPAVKKIAKANNIPLIDVNRFFMRRKSLLPGIHPSKKGYYEMARFIYRSIIPYIKGLEPLKKERLPEIFSGKIFFQSDRARNEDVYVITRKGVERLTKSPFFDGYPSSSPDGKKIVFESNRSGRFEIYIMELETKRIKKILSSPSDDRYPFWSYDGKYIYFARKIGRREQIFRYNVKTENVEQITNYRGRNSLPSASPDNRFILLTSNRFIGWNVYMIDTLEKKVLKISENYGGCRAKFSHKGNLIAWVTHKFDKKGDIVLTSLSDIKSHRRLTLNSKKHDYCPSFSPDDKYIVYASGPKLKEGNYELMVIEIASGKMWKLTNSPAKDMVPYWSK